MATAREQMKIVEGELERIRAEIARLRAQEDVLEGVLRKYSGNDAPPAEPAARKRSANVKPLVLEIMHQAGFVGRTSAEVDEEVRKTVPTVAKDTVGSLLSRLKADGALSFDGERYYEKQFAPNAPAGLRAVM
jgi:hypothetical protein